MFTPKPVASMIWEWLDCPAVRLGNQQCISRAFLSEFRGLQTIGPAIDKAAVSWTQEAPARPGVGRKRRRR